jgi:PD-(D/E)XK nuclease superfamily
MAPCISSASVSRFQVYLSCAHLFFEKYINKSGALVETKQTALIQGSLAHSMVEAILNDTDLETQLPIILSDWLLEVCDLQVANSTEEMVAQKGIEIDALIYYADQLSPLLERCSESYLGSDRIRTNAGKVLTDPVNYPSSGFLQAYALLNISEHKQNIDISAARQHPDFALNNISLSSIVATAYTYAKLFTYPKDFKETIAVELDLGVHGLELIPGVAWKGYIDWVYRTNSGEIVIVDHKTNKLLPNELEVNHHEQLNVYAGLYYEIYGEWPARVGIQHLKTNTLVTSEVDPSIATEIYKYYKEIALEIITPRTTWLRQSPAKVYAGTCVKKFGPTTYVCPLISRCWPQFNPASISS